MTILTIIDKKKELDVKADVSYKAIEKWHRESDSGYIVDTPMNVPADFMGKSDRPHHKNSFILAKAYFDFLRENDLSANTINEFIEFFSMPFCGSNEYKKIAQQNVDKNFAVIEDTFVGALRDFSNGLSEMKYLLDTLKVDQVNAKTDFDTLLTRYANYLIKNNYNPEIIEAACKKAIENSDQKESQLNDHFDMNLATLYKIDNQFYSMMVERAVHFNILNNKVIRIDSSTEEKTSKLSKFLILHLPCDSINHFQSIFNQCYLQNSSKPVVKDASKAKAVKWAALFSESEGRSKEREEHHQKFSASLDAIRRNPRF